MAKIKNNSNSKKKLSEFGCEPIEVPSVLVELDLDDDCIKKVEKLRDDMGFLSKGEAIRFLLGQLLFQDKNKVNNKKKLKVSKKK